MKEYIYIGKEMKILKANPYTFKVTKKKLYFIAEFKEVFQTEYQRYELKMISQKQ